MPFRLNESGAARPAITAQVCLDDRPIRFVGLGVKIGVSLSSRQWG
jgi:hypothetical protein